MAKKIKGLKKVHTFKESPPHPLDLLLEDGAIELLCALIEARRMHRHVYKSK